ncbi:hypothetical protein LJ656_32370 [Paraburkholderia sp. MMS20-SJTR3]|uniref:Uncharacterized protein n=1 Tax=Paraburkholderia sejongensis TaxID=2886946 RepID=A0ABS8K548_9BURK|nr:hypothetical protein [Paraburkholderia sp. MMS20-SJTR3]MCC8397271.1 hypothetical protein [Paraburkholderia sp. MMS20-SJTR3]
MSDKLQMKVVIDEVTTPLLYARLSAARSPRERAALLRSIAEAGLRDAVNGESSRATRASADGLVVAGRQSESQPAPFREVQSRPHELPLEVTSVDSFDHAHDTDALANEFASFF